MKFVAVSITVQTDSGYRSRQSFNSRDHFEDPKVTLWHAFDAIVRLMGQEGFDVVKLTEEVIKNEPN